MQPFQLNLIFYAFTILGHYLIDFSLSFKGLWQIPLVMWNDLGNGRCSMLDACSNPNNPEDVFKLLWTNFARHYNTNRAPIGTYFFLSCTSSTYLDSLLMADKAKLLLLKLIHLFAREVLLIRKLEIEETKTTQNSTFKTGIIKMGLVFSISNFFYY